MGLLGIEECKASKRDAYLCCITILTLEKFVLEMIDGFFFLGYALMVVLFANIYYLCPQAAFVPQPDSIDDTSYFVSRYNSDGARDDDDYDDSTSVISEPFSNSSLEASSCIMCSYVFLTIDLKTNETCEKIYRVEQFAL